MKHLLFSLFSGAILLAPGTAFSQKTAFPDVAWKDLLKVNEWKQLGGKATYEVKDGMVTGTSVPATPNSFLATERNYGDFVLEYDFKVDPLLNSGVQIRSQSLTDYRNGRVHGYQVEIDPSERAWTAGVYDEGRRGWLNNLEKNEAARKAFRQGEWNKVRVEAIGDRIKTFLNEVPAADLTDSMTLSGFIALQVHGVGKHAEKVGKTVQWRNLRIKDLGRHEWKPLFNGKDLTGWKTLPGGTWSVENGVIVGKSPRSEPKHGILLSEKRFGDFAVRAQFKVVKGDSGFYFRAESVASGVSVNGFQVEVDSSMETGGLYETGGRAWVVNPAKRPKAEGGPSNGKKKKKPAYEPGQWTQLDLSARGGNVQVFLDHRLTAALKDDPGNREGHFGLQLHGGQEMEVYFKDLQILQKAED